MQGAGYRVQAAERASAQARVCAWARGKDVHAMLSTLDFFEQLRGGEGWAREALV